MRFARYAPQISQPTAVAIGSFDGLHRGHVSLLARLTQVSEDLQISPWVLTFYPSPKAFFGKIEAKVLCQVRTRLIHLSQLGIQGVWMPPFGQKWANTRPDDFIESVLKKRLRAQVVVVGEDFRFGYERAGDINTLRAAGLEVITPQMVCDEQGPVSASRIRKALQNDDFTAANTALGRAYALSGRVMHGQKRGRSLGFPTANIRVREPIVLSGVFVVKAQIEGQWKTGVANVGMRPTFGGHRRACEVHFFDFDGNLYGQRVSVVFMKKIRDEIKFDGPATLVAQIKQDKQQAEQWLLRQTT